MGVMTKEQVLKEYFGYENFRTGQEYLIKNILEGNDVIGVMPTGAGKSLCFQIPALLMEGLTIVVSPLISLMKDQVTALREVGVRAAFLNSSLSQSEYQTVLEEARSGAYKLLYVAPERLLTESFLRFSADKKISMVTVDEAHCMSQWGQDFRPSYVAIAEYIKRIKDKPVVSAFTATATEEVRADIGAILELRDPTVLVTGFNRENLSFSVSKPQKKLKTLLRFLEDRRDQVGIVYCSTRKNVEKVCGELLSKGYNATRYHAGLGDEERKENQERFIFDQVDIIVATNAFGMGIDKSNVSYVVHYNMPKNLESYYQEAGRAGRDGSPADCLLLYSGQDVRTNTFLIENGQSSDFKDYATEQMVKARDKERLKEMTFYCHTTDCLRAYILKYFGESAPNYCGNCSSCNSNFETIDITLEAKKIISCVYRVEERYGAKMIIDILRGSKNERLLRMGLDNLSTYNISTTGDKRLREIINFLVLSGYLEATTNEYPVLRIGPLAQKFLKNTEVLTMKLNREESFMEKKAPLEPIVKDLNSNLLIELKELRLSLAKKSGVPAFVVFTDSSLVDMCLKLPRTEEDFLNVSGVGQAKLLKYGQIFLEKIAIFKGDEPGEVEEPQLRVMNQNITVSLLADLLSSFLLQKGREKISAQKLNKWLMLKGMLVLEDKYKVPSELGLEHGIVRAEKIKATGERYPLAMYTPLAQEYIIGQIEEIS